MMNLERALKEKLAAARAFTKAGFKPSRLSLDRTIAQGMPFVELIEQGADGKETAEKLIRIEKRGAVAKAKLDALLGDRTPSRPYVSDMGRQAFNEGAYSKKNNHIASAGKMIYKKVN